MEVGGRRVHGDLGRVVGGEKCNQDTLYKIFLLKKMSPRYTLSSVLALVCINILERSPGLY